MGGLPITPHQAATGRQVPTAVVEAFNECIAQRYDVESRRAVVRQEDVVALLVERGFDRNTIFDKGWLNVEPIYESVGWNVRYDKPGYSEDYPATFAFEAKR